MKEEIDQSYVYNHWAQMGIQSSYSHVNIHTSKRRSFCQKKRQNYILPV